MLIVKASRGGEKAMHCLTLMMRANGKLNLDLGNPDSIPPTPYAYFFVTVTLLSPTAQDHSNLARLC